MQQDISEISYIQQEEQSWVSWILPESQDVNIYVNIYVFGYEFACLFTSNKSLPVENPVEWSSDVGREYFTFTGIRLIKGH